MPVKKLKKFLDNNDVKYVSISHSPAYSAQAIAESAYSGKGAGKNGDRKDRRQVRYGGFTRFFPSTFEPSESRHISIPR